LKGKGQKESGGQEPGKWEGGGRNKFQLRESNKSGVQGKKTSYHDEGTEGWGTIERGKKEPAGQEETKHREPGLHLARLRGKEKNSGPQTEKENKREGRNKC